MNQRHRTRGQRSTHWVGGCTASRSGVRGSARRSATLAALVVLALAAPAGAQAPPVDYVRSNGGIGGIDQGPGIRLQFNEPRGIRVGSFIIWPSLFLEGRWDSNLFAKADADQGKIVDAPVLRIVPAVALKNPHPRTLGFTLGVETDVRLYISDNADVSDQQNVGVKADLALDILPRGPVTVTLYDVFRRDLQTRNFDSPQTYNQNLNKGGVRVSIHPGGGALNIALGYGFAISKFDDYPMGDYLFHEIQLLTTWRFYPKTAAFLEVLSEIRDWDTEPDRGRFVDGAPIRVNLGLSGYLTKKLAVLLKLGYGNGLYESGPNFGDVDCEGSSEVDKCRFVGFLNTLLVHAEVAARFTPTVLLAAGYKRDFRDSFYGNFYTEGTTYLRGQFRFWRRVGLEFALGYHLIDFAPWDPGAEGIPNVRVSHTRRRDQAVSANVKVDVDITRWIGVTLGYETRAVFSNFFIEEVRAGGVFIDYGRYTRHQVYASVNVRY